MCVCICGGKGTTTVLLCVNHSPALPFCRALGTKSGVWESAKVMRSFSSYFSTDPYLEGASSFCNVAKEQKVRRRAGGLNQNACALTLMLHHFFLLHSRSKGGVKDSGGGSLCLSLGYMHVLYQINHKFDIAKWDS